MRISVSLNNCANENLRLMAKELKVPISALVSEAVEHYIFWQRKQKLANQVLNIVEKINISDEAFDEIHKYREDNDDRL